MRLLLAAALLLTACRPPATGVRAWAHAGQESERRVLTEQVARYNLAHPGGRIELTFLPEGSYNSQVQAAALAGELPDVLEFDGPLLASYVWQRQLVPIPTSLEQGLLPSLRRQGTLDGVLYGVGVYDSGLGLYVRPSLVRNAGLRVPTRPEEAWTLPEFETLLSRLAAADPDGAVLDLKRNYRGEWYTYAFAPCFESAGADLGDGGLADPAARVVAAALQGWQTHGYVDPNLDDAAFTQGRVALSWAGHWEYPRYSSTFPDDLAVVPLPNFGQRSRTGQGSWCWGATRSNPEVFAFLAYLLQEPQVRELTDANGAVPGTLEAIRKSSRYGPGGPLQLFARQLTDGTAVPRPQTAGYPVFTSLFQRAMLDLFAGAPPESVLRHASHQWLQDVRDNRGYR